uniref:Putative major epididymal secretory protein he1 n=1 Tax=Lutzomyia longipalpis TaxID=7200 RepID=A0A1B0CC75_LUTLO
RFLFFLTLLSTALAVKLEKCKSRPSRPLPLELRSTTCNETRCSISKSAPVGFELDLKIRNNTEHVFPSTLLIYKLPDHHIGEIPVEIDVNRGCDYLISHSCPLKKDDIVTWAFDWDFLPDEVFGVGVTFKAEISLYDGAADPVACFRVDLIIDE